MKKYFAIALATLSLASVSCSEDWMSDVVPTNKLDAGDAIKNITDARNALNGVYSIMQDEEYYGANYIVYGDLKGVDVRSWDITKRDNAFYRYTETTDASSTGMWTIPYSCLVSANNALDNITKLNIETPADQAKVDEIVANLFAVRGMVHFDLLKMYSRIPTAVTGALSEQMGVVLADHVISKDEQPARASLDKSYEFVVKDLEDALAKMPENANTQGWFNTQSIKALLARVNLYMGNYQQAFDYATQVIDSKKYSLLTSGEYVNSWKSNIINSEAIFTLINTEEDNPSREGVGYLWSATGYNTMAVTKSMIDMLRADANDVRNQVVADNGLLYKYHNEAYNNLYLIRLSEMYFIAAEASFLKGDASSVARGYINDVLAIRTNSATSLADADISLDRIILEKRKEFVGEGHCFFDLIRNKKNVERVGADHLVGTPRNIAFDAFNIVQPIPRIELDANRNIVQNPGYQE